MGNALATQVVAPLAPLFQPELGLSKMDVGLFSSAIFAGWWIVLLAAGSLADRFGVRIMISAGLFLTALLLLAMGTVVSFFQAVAVMLAAGLASGMAQPAVSKGITEWFMPRSRATAMGLKQAAVPVAGIVTAATLPVLGLAMGWRFAMAVVGFYLLAAAAFIWIFYREPHGGRQSVKVGTSVRAGLGAVLANRRLWAMSTMSILLVSGQMALTTYLALYFSDEVLVPLIPEVDARIVAAGAYLALCQAGGAFGRVFWGVVSDRLFRARRLPVMGIVGLVAASMGVLLANFGHGFPTELMAPVLFVYGATSIGWSGLYHAAMAESEDRRYAGTGLGLGMTLNQCGTVAAPPLFGFVVDLTGSYQIAWFLAAGVSGFGGLMALVLAPGEKQRG